MQRDHYTPRNTEAAVEHWGKMLFRICFTILCNSADAEDALQEVFIKYLSKAPAFDSEAYEKAWLIRVAANTAKTMALFRNRHRHVQLEDVQALISLPEDREVFLEVMKLPDRYKIVMDLFYIEGYRTREISVMLAISEAAVRKRLQKGREMLRLTYSEGREQHEQKQLCESDERCTDTRWNGKQNPEGLQ